MEHQKRLILYATVFLTGAAVLIIEIAGVRILSPYFGTSLVVFSSILTVILGALSAGYVIGGKLSDQLPVHTPLFRIITIAGITTLCTEFLALMLLEQTSTLFPSIFGPLVSALCLFFIPAFLLGIVSPYVVTLTGQHAPSNERGTVTGIVFFWGTIGSITGSLLTGFVLVPTLGLMKSIVGTGLMLILLGVLGNLLLDKLTTPSRSLLSFITRDRVFLFITLLTTTLLLTGIRVGSTTNTDVVYEGEGLYSHILVYDTVYRGEEVRILKRDQNHSSGVFLHSREHVFEYTQFADLYRELVPNTKEYLVIGGGAYTVPRAILNDDPGIHFDVVEIEPELYDLATQYFDLDPQLNLTNYIQDARVFLNETDKQYDAIFLDAFSTDMSVPPHLVSVEFFESIKAHLAPDGVMIMNTIGNISEDAPTLIGSIAKTIEHVFPNTKMYPLNKRFPEALQNVMFIARNGETPITTGEAYIVPRTAFGLSQKKVSTLEMPLTVFTESEELLLTDDKAPVEFLILGTK